MDDGETESGLGTCDQATVPRVREVVIIRLCCCAGESVCRERMVCRILSAGNPLVQLGI